MSAGEDRIFGLDVMRATAILLVVFWHSYDSITHLAPGFRAPFFLDGVDLFFVLSGYLIGGILLGAARKPGLSWRQRLTGFWQRRFFRTLPNYYLFLVINMVLVALGISNGLLNHNALAYVALLHNLWKPFSLFFWESWSLVVEVWFYILFPLIVVACSALFPRRMLRTFLLGSALFLVVPLLLRFRMVPYVPSMTVMEDTVREVAIMRLDTVVYGLVAALVQVRLPGPWRRLRWPLFGAGLAGMCIVASNYGETHLAYSTTWYYSVNAISMALLLPLLSSWVKEPRWGRPITTLSLLSYALFLVHKPLRMILEHFFNSCAPFEDWSRLLGYWALCLMLAWLVYRYFEKPMMDLRERFARR